MSRRPWWEWDAAELVHAVEFPAGFKADYYEKPHGKDLWRKYLIEGEPVEFSVSDISGAVDDGGKASGMAYKAFQIGLLGVCEIIRGGEWKADPKWFETELKARKLTHQDVWSEKADLGTTIHKALENLCEGNVPKLSDYPTDEQPYIKAICGWFADHDPSVLHQEMLVASRVYGYAGRFDLLYERNGQTVLADLKTAKDIRPSHLIQLAGYSLAMEECGYDRPDRLEVIWAKPDGSYKVFESGATHQQFIHNLNALRGYRAHKQHLELEMAAA